MAKKKTKTKSQKTSAKGRLSALKDNFKNFKFRFILGIITIGVAFYFLLAFFSFLFTGFADKSIFDINRWELFTSSDIAVKNWTGHRGALIADLFINQGIGIAAFSVVLLLFVIGFRLLGARVLPLRKTFLHCFVISVWLSVALGFLFISSVNDQYLLLGGTHGYFMSKWLTAAIGGVGTVILLLVTLLIYLSVTFDSFFHFISKPLNKEQKAEEELAVSEPGSDVSANDVTEPDTTTPVPVEELSFDKEIELEEKEVIQQVEEAPVESPQEPMAGSTLEFSPTVDKNMVDDEASLDLTIEKVEEEELSDDYENEPLGDYDPTLDLSSYKLPGVELLDDHSADNSEVSMEELESNKNRIVKTLEDYKIQIKNIKATVGPTVTLYEIVPAPGVRISKIKNLEDDIALSLAALGIRIIAPIPGRGTIGIEVPNSEPEVVAMRSIISAKKFQNTKYELPIALGKTISNETFVIDLAKAPHMLVAGATGQGKSVGLNAIISSLLYKKHPSQLKFVMVDPKKVELNIYSKIERHFLAKMPDEEDPIITDVQKVVNTLNSLAIEMDNRYELLKTAHARNIKEYNHKFVKRQLNPEKGHRFLPYIVVIIDEFADLIMTAGKEVELPIARIAQLARAVGIHMIVATQRPSTNIITGVIKANFPTRVAFKVASMIDSRTILDSPGANQLIGRGDMLISQGSDLVRVQCAFVDTPEVERINDFIGSQRGYTSAFLLPEYVGESSSEPAAGEVDLSKRDPMFEEAARVVVANQSGSTSLIQRRFSIGYNRAGRIIDQLEAAGVVGPFEGSKARQVLIPDELELEKHLAQFN
ncbi:DNA translocase FtsK 4TM domain-containing protein [Carboxylicivirga sediminis]|uniref:DNA translocase FtsK 4TM domain-containing protein n=1 Tax=Carboxylicivirga sediminis TaxID=2006564 RepID=A0A941IX42_9BACT|nr:DNA translocase FtsK [Carboxylicivirga sediminis]MBR8535198.1 DNA translocase FtsK 4TM domain-containing protein [Carboxylicivirga sediminis]